MNPMNARTRCTESPRDYADGVSHHEVPEVVVPAICRCGKMFQEMEALRAHLIGVDQTPIEAPNP